MNVHMHTHTDTHTDIADWCRSGRDLSSTVRETSEIISLSPQNYVYRGGVESTGGRRQWKPTPIFLPGKSHGRRSLVGYSPWSHKRVRHNLVTKQQQ